MAKKNTKLEKENFENWIVQKIQRIRAEQSSVNGMEVFENLRKSP